jgi:hypothetical protein
MIILRQKNYSKSKKSDENKEEEKKKSKKKIVSGVGHIVGGAAGVVGGIKLSRKLQTKAGEKEFKEELISMLRSENPKTKEEHNNVIRNLRNKAKDLGVKIKNHEYNNYYDPNNDTIYVSEPVSPYALAHEMGHASMMKKGRSKDIIGKAAHSKVGDLLGAYRDNASSFTEDAESKKEKALIHASRGLFLGDGIRRGIKSAEKMESGDKKGAKKVIRSGILVSALSAAPTLVKEGSATRKGLKYLKKAGASKGTMKNARRGMGHAFGTYVAGSGIPLALEVGGTAIGYGAHKLISKSKNKQEKKNKNKKGE